MSIKVPLEELKFSLYKYAHEMMMYESYYRDGQWDEGKIVPFHSIELSPAANILNYGQGIFEGMKAYRSSTGKIVMFRPEKNAQRFVRSTHKLAMPPVPEEKYLDAVRRVVLANEAFIPQDLTGRYSLYLRPVCVGIEPLLGVRASSEYLFYIFGSPVGPYFDKVGVVRLIVTDVHRAAPHGTGDSKAASNYAVTMLPKREAQQQGFNDALYLDAAQNKFIEEAGAANFFALMADGALVTPEKGSILPGITRESVIQLAREALGMKVEERLLSVEEVCKGAKECFVTGTAAVITSVSEISWNGTVFNVNNNDFRLAHQLYDKLVGILSVG